MARLTLGLAQRRKSQDLLGLQSCSFVWLSWQVCTAGTPPCALQHRKCKTHPFTELSCVIAKVACQPLGGCQPHIDSRQTLLWKSCRQLRLFIWKCMANSSHSRHAEGMFDPFHRSIGARSVDPHPSILRHFRCETHAIWGQTYYLPNSHSRKIILVNSMVFWSTKEKF